MAVAALAVVLALQGPQRVSGPPSPVATPVPLTTPAPTAPDPAPTEPVLPHDRVVAAAPTHFLITGPGFTVSANVCRMEPVFPLDPPGDQVHTVSRVDHGFG